MGEAMTWVALFFLATTVLVFWRWRRDVQLLTWVLDQAHETDDVWCEVVSRVLSDAATPFDIASAEIRVDAHRRARLWRLSQSDALKAQD